MEYNRIQVDWVLSSYKGFQLIDKYLEGRIEEINFDPTFTPIIEALGFEERKVRTPKGKFDVMGWVLDLEEIGEFEELPLLQDDIVGEKGYDTSRFGGARGMSRRATEWLKVCKWEMPDFVKKSIDDLVFGYTRLNKRADKSKNFLITRVFTEGLKDELKPYWPWSPTIKGKPLYAVDHPYGDNNGTPIGTQSNKMTYVLNKQSLLHWIDMLRVMRDENGTRMGVPQRVTLVVPSKLARKARQTLSDWMNFVGDEALNSNVPNTFSWEGFQVKLVVLDTLGQPSSEYGTVGDDKQWFIIDAEKAREVGAFKFIYLYDKLISFWFDNKSKGTFYDVDVEYTADHYNYQVTVGSTGVDEVPEDWIPELN